MYRSIVVGTDGSETAGEAGRQATELAKSVGASVHLVSAYSPAPDARLRQERQHAPEEIQWSINPREDVEETLRQAVENVSQAGVKVETYAREGDSADAPYDGCRPAPRLRGRGCTARSW